MFQITTKKYNLKICHFKTFVVKLFFNAFASNFAGINFKVRVWTVYIKL